MKPIRLITIFLAFAIAISAWTPTPVLAKPETTIAINIGINAAASAKITADNQTGATLMIKLVGIGNNRKYNLSTNIPGIKTFNIVPGKYKITMTTTGCPGSVVYTKNLKAKTTTPLGAVGCG